MNWNTFKEKLYAHPELHLQFQYADNSWVNADYHITEIKQVQITSVDCGGRSDAWPEIVIQLWEPKSTSAEEAMKVEKALKIIGIVEDKIVLPPTAAVKIEYGNPAFGTRQMPVSEIWVEGGNLNISLAPDTTQCKASDVCGKPRVRLSELTPAANCCDSESGCC